MRRGLLLAVVLAGLVAAAPAGSAQQLVWMRENTGQVFATVAVDTNGHGEVGFFIGETTGTHYHAFTLGRAGLARLRAQVAAVRRLPRSSYLRAQPALPFVADTIYVVETGSRAIQADESDLPAGLRPAVKTLAALIVRYAQVASSSTRRAPGSGLSGPS